MQDVMHYFGWNFSAYVIAMCIVFINTGRSVYYYMGNKKRNVISKHGGIDIIISVLCGAVLAGGMVFQGILADNNAPDWNAWTNRLLIICGVSVALFVVQIVFYFKTPSHESKSDRSIHNEPDALR